MDNGFDMHWLGRIVQPWLVHPITGQEIPLRVEDYTPFLDESVGVFAHDGDLDSAAMVLLLHYS